MPAVLEPQLASWSESPTWAVAAVLLVVVYSIWTFASAFRPSLIGIPGPVTAKFSRGYLFYHAIKGDFNTLYRELHDKHGSVVRVGPNKVSISDPAAIPTIYGISSRFTKSKFYNAFSVVLQGKVNDNMFSTSDKEHHKRLKTPVAQAYSLSSLRQLEPMVNDCSKLFLDAMHSINGEPIDLSEWLQWYAFDVIGKITFHQTFGFLEHREDRLGTIDALEGGIKYASTIGQVPELHPFLMGNVKLQSFINNTPGIEKMNPFKRTEKMIMGAAETYGSTDTKQRGDYLEFLRTQQEKHPGRISDWQLMAYLGVNLGAGSDTTAMALRAIFYFLVKNPRVYEKLMQEIDEADAEGRLSEYVEFGQGQELKYMQAVIKEAMRLHPGVGMPLERVVPEGGTTLCGKFFPEGTVVGINAWVVHHNKEVYGFDTDTFRPERWLEAEPAQLKMMEQSFLSFGHGSRTCIGKNISILEMTKFVPQLLRHFRLEWASPKEEWDLSGVWFVKQSGMLMRVIPRKQ